MAGRVDDLDRQPADLEPLAVLKQPVEIAAFGLDVRGAEDRAEDSLHFADMLADRDRRARCGP